MENFNALYLFLRVAQAGSFTAAAQQLGVSKSSLSQHIAHLEKRLGVRLLNRTTRSIAPTAAGERVLEHIAPHFAAIRSEIEELSDFRDTPAGIVRINASQLAAQWVIQPALRDFLPRYPHIHIDLQMDNRFADIVAQGFDMGVRLGDAVGKEMIAVQISAPVQMALVASPAYLQGKAHPKNIEDLQNHTLIATRFAADRGAVVAWELLHQGKIEEYVPQAQCIVSQNVDHSALLGLGITWLPRMAVEKALESGALQEILPETAVTYDPLYLYYPSRRGNSVVFKLVVEALRWRGDKAE